MPGNKCSRELIFTPLWFPQWLSGLSTCHELGRGVVGIWGYLIYSDVCSVIFSCEAYQS